MGSATLFLVGIGFVMLGVAAVGVMYLIFLRHHLSRAREKVNQWASRNGYRLESVEVRHFWRGPYFLTTRSQEVFYVRLLDTEGKVRNVYVRVGGFFLGMWSDHVDVSWR